MKIYHFVVFGILISAWPLYLLIKKFSRRSNEPSNWIIGGVNANDGEFPYVAALKLYADDLERCGGSIIGAKWILTAAHCVNEYRPEYYIKNAYFLVGTIDFYFGGTAQNISNIIFHPDSDRYDLALIELKPQIEFNNKTSSIALAHNRAPDNSTVTAIGWGRINNNASHTDILQKIQLHTISIDKCCDLDSPYCDEFMDPYYQTTVCTLDPIGKDTCHGDSGGPLIYNNTQIGVVIRGSENCGIGKPAIFASVAYYRDWIHRVTGIV